MVLYQHRCLRKFLLETTEMAWKGERMEVDHVRGDPARGGKRPGGDGAGPEPQTAAETRLLGLLHEQETDPVLSEVGLLAGGLENGDAAAGLCYRTGNLGQAPPFFKHTARVPGVGDHGIQVDDPESVIHRGAALGLRYRPWGPVSEGHGIHRSARSAAVDRPSSTS